MFDVCKIVDYNKGHIKDTVYYELIPILDSSLKIVVPLGSGYLRSVLFKDEAEAIIDKISSIDVIEASGRLIENEYKRLLI